MKVIGEVGRARDGSGKSTSGIGIVQLTCGASEGEVKPDFGSVQTHDCFGCHGHVDIMELLSRSKVSISHCPCSTGQVLIVSESLNARLGILLEHKSARHLPPCLNSSAVTTLAIVSDDRILTGGSKLRARIVRVIATLRTSLTLVSASVRDCIVDCILKGS